jgi:hypothetical protein
VVPQVASGQEAATEKTDQDGVPKSVFPAAARDWDRIGIYNLREKDKAAPVVTVIVYAEDSDVAAEKEALRKGEPQGSFYPNDFAFHGVCRVGD